MGKTTVDHEVVQEVLSKLGECENRWQVKCKICKCKGDA